MAILGPIEGICCNSSTVTFIRESIFLNSLTRISATSLPTCEMLNPVIILENGFDLLFSIESSKLLMLFSPILSIFSR